MDALAFFMTRYEDSHGRFTDELLADLADDQMRRRPHPSVNTIA